MRFTWVSNAPWCQTGYGNQTKLFVPRIVREGHDGAIIAFYGHEGTPITWSAPKIADANITVFGKGLDPYGVDVMGAHTVNFDGQVMFTLIDAWVLKPEAIPPDIYWVPWFPVDMEPIPPIVAEKVEKAHKRVVFSRFAERMVNNAGMDCDYVPHGVDTIAFSPKDRHLARERLGWPQDQYIFGMVAANKGSHLHTPSRKAFVQHLEAFKLVHEKHPDTMFYLHTSIGSRGEWSGLDLSALIKYFNLGDSVKFPLPYDYMIGLPDDVMADIYSAMDVHILASMGEGFGIPTLEAQACGTPVIVGDWAASGELCFSGWKIPKSDAMPYWIPNLNSYQWLIHPAALAEWMELAYQDQGNEKKRKKARQGALSYDADKVTKEYWVPVLNELQEELDNVKTMPEMNLVQFT